MTTCPKCGVEQDEAKPRCPHMMGRRGGVITRERYGKEFYRKMGKKGGAEIAKRGSGHFQRIGKLGGAAVRAKMGEEYFESIGAKGGAKNKERLRLEEQKMDERARDLEKSE